MSPPPALELEGTVACISRDARSYFKRFPRELRDCIYDLLYQEIEESIAGHELHTRAIIPRLRLVSRQFKSEYDERIASDVWNQHLTMTYTAEVHDWSHFRRCCIYALCTPLAAHTTSITLNMRFDSGGLYHSEPMGHAKWMNELRQKSYFPRLQRFRAYIKVRHYSYIALRALQFLGHSMAGTAEVELLCWDDIAGSSAPLATWSMKRGLQENEHAIARLDSRSWTDGMVSFAREV
jgi:hypothetical protein